MRDGSGDNAGESGFISSRYGVQRHSSCSCIDIRVPLDLCQCSWGLSGIPSRKSRLLSCLMENKELLCTQCGEIGSHLMDSGESHDFSQVAAGTCGIFSTYARDAPSKLVFVQRHQDSCLVSRESSEYSTKLGRAIGTPLKVRRETQGPFPVATGILGFLSIFKRSQESSPFETLNSACLSRCQRDVRPSVEMRRGLLTFSNVSTWNSDIPSSCEMKDKPSFKSRQGNLAFFRIMASWCPFHLRQQTQGPSPYL